MLIAAEKRGREKGASDQKRLQYIVSAIENRETLQSIADRFGITRERVRQIAAKAGVKSFRYKDLKASRDAAAQLRAKKIEKRQAIERAMVEMVKSGESIRQAGMALGLTRSKTETIARRLKLGRITKHGWWRLRRGRKA